MTQEPVVLHLVPDYPHRDAHVARPDCPCQPTEGKEPYVKGGILWVHKAEWSGLPQIATQVSGV